MSRTLYDIAASGLDDLYAMQTEFSQIETLFSTLASNFPTGSNLREFADFALSVNKDWADKAAQWVDCMDDELDGFPEENRAHFAKHLRREALRAGGAA